MTKRKQNNLNLIFSAFSVKENDVLENEKSRININQREIQLKKDEEIGKNSP
jgi:hypothetical protein